MQYFVPITRSDPLVKAFQFGNYQSQGWTTLYPQGNPPVSTSTGSGGVNDPPLNPIINPAAPGLATTLPSGQPGMGIDGCYPVGEASIYAPLGISLFPYCQGIANVNFSMRLYGWRQIKLPDGNPATDVWIPFLLVELACWSCDMPGPSPYAFNANAQTKISALENFCDTIVLTQGSYGFTGNINSTGGRDQGSAGTNLIAHATVELKGAKSIQFDFAPLNGSAPLPNSTPTNDIVPMNCLWGFC